MSFFFFIYRRSSSTWRIMLHRHVSAEAQKGQTKQWQWRSSFVFLLRFAHTVWRAEWAEKTFSQSATSLLATTKSYTLDHKREVLLSFKVWGLESDTSKKEIKLRLILQIPQSLNFWSIKRGNSREQQFWNWSVFNGQAACLLDSSCNANIL